MATASTARSTFAMNCSVPLFNSPGFLDSSKVPDAHQGSRTSSSDKLMAQTPRTHDPTPSVALTTSLTSQDSNQTEPRSANLNNHELIEIASNPVVEGILGPNRDGRVRNPVPSKLKGKTDTKMGNFGVMQMGSSSGKKDSIHGRDVAAERDAAALKTSEATAYRAKAAQSDRYVPPTRRIRDGTANNLVVGRGLSLVASGKPRAKPLAPAEIKYEQARLLTLLRSINPITVVDQICKAVAYFGGIPGAPPPEDGIFPESANTRDTGALFIGWLAEIFPDLSVQSPKVFNEVPFNTEIKSNSNKSDTQGEIPLSELPNSSNSYGHGTAVSGAILGTSVSHIGDPSPVLQSKRRRGRPKGSRNKKSNVQLASENKVSIHLNTDGRDQIEAALKAPSINPPPTCLTNCLNQEVPVAQSPGTILNQSGAANPNPATQYEELTWPDSQQTPVKLGQNPTISSSGELSPEECAVLETFGEHDAEALGDISSPVIAAKNTPEVGQKRKRAPSKPNSLSSSTAAPALDTSPHPYPNTNFTSSGSNKGHTHHSQSHSLPGALSLGKDTTNITGNDTMQWASLDSAEPPLKRLRHRKPKISISGVPQSQNLVTSAARNATPPNSQTSSRADNQPSLSQQSPPASRPLVEGLEAHYERFASLQQHNNSGNYMPTALQHQHVRQQLEASATPGQQMMSKMTQQQIQPPNPQQSLITNSNQRDDLKLAQGRPPSAPFYNQRAPVLTATAPYSQQFGPRQPSQFYYGHQSSPKMSNSAYRGPNTQKITQPSSQCPLAETSYRTSSPHNMSQSSPSFSQAENVYRPPSTHAPAQPTQSFSNPHSHTQPQAQATQPSYSHFSDSTFIDLPNLESLGHSSSSGNPGVSPTASGYNQGMNIALGSSRGSVINNNNNSLYSTSPALNPHDTGLLRGISRNGHNVNAPVGTSPSGMNNTYDGSNVHEIRERLMNGLRQHRP